MLVPPARKRVVNIHELLGKLVQVEPAIRIAIDFEPGRGDGVFRTVAESETGTLESRMFFDVDGDGRLDVLELDPPTPGFYHRGRNERWDPFSSKSI